MLGFRGAMLLGDINLHKKTNVCRILPVFYLKVMKAVVIRNFVIAKKKENGNITGARWQDIRHRGEIIAVNRRTGGLENLGRPCRS